MRDHDESDRSDSDDTSAAAGGDPRDDVPADTSLDDVLRELEDLEQTVDSADERKELQDVRLAVERLPGGAFLGKRIERYTTRDVAEGFVGSIIFALPLLVEDGVNDIAGHFLAVTVATVPVWLLANLAFTVLMTWGLLYWADFRDVREANPFFGVLPRRLVGVLAIAFLTAALTMTMWGRVTWADPVIALSRVTVVWTAGAFGAALGDILPGQSAGTELRDIPDEIGERAEGFGNALSGDD